MTFQVFHDLYEHFAQTRKKYGRKKTSLKILSFLVKKLNDLFYLRFPNT